jgi:hypothetical protein
LKRVPLTGGVPQTIAGLGAYRDQIGLALDDTEFFFYTYAHDGLMLLRGPKSGAPSALVTSDFGTLAPKRERGAVWLTSSTLNVYDGDGSTRHSIPLGRQNEMLFGAGSKSAFVVQAASDPMNPTWKIRAYPIDVLGGPDVELTGALSALPTVTSDGDTVYYVDSRRVYRVGVGEPASLFLADIGVFGGDQTKVLEMAASGTDLYLRTQNCAGACDAPYVQAIWRIDATSRTTSQIAQFSQDFAPQTTRIMTADSCGVHWAKSYNDVWSFVR